MPVVELRPGPVYFYDVRATAPLDTVAPAVVVGTGAVWADDDDATYVDTEFQQQAGPTLYSSTLSADIDPLNIPGATLNSVGYRVRGMGLVADVDPRVWFTEKGSDRYIYEPTVWASGGMPATPSTVEDTDVPSLWDEAILNIGLRVSVFALNQTEELRPAWRCHEITLIVDYTAPDTVHGIPPLRQVQRGDGQGFSTAPRFLRGNALRNFGYR